MCKVAILTVIYPQAKPFFFDFFESLRNQDYKDFDLVIINDGVEDFNIDLLKDLNYRVEDYSLNPSKNREHGLNITYELGYDKVILCDIDDIFKKDRIKISLEYLKSFDCVVNDLDTVDYHGKPLITDYFSKSHSIPHKITLDFLLDKNICGFSNTAVNIKKIYPISFPSDVSIVDWYFFTQLSIKGCSIGFIPYSLTKYRQHTNNEIGIGILEISSFKKMIRLKKEHYHHISKIDNSNKIKKRMEMCDTMENLDDDEIAYILNKNQIINQYPLWWENIKL